MTSSPTNGTVPNDSGRAFINFSVEESPGTSPHAFTIALTPVGDNWEPPYDPKTKQRVSVNARGVDTHVYQQPGTTAGTAGEFGIGGPPANNNVTKSRSFTWSGDQKLPFQGRSLEHQDRRPFKVGNWLEEILDVYGISTGGSGSMLPTGSRVFLEVATGTGPGTVFAGVQKDVFGEEWARVSSGCWVGSVKCAFDVETADGTAYTTNVEVLGDDEGE